MRDLVFIKDQIVFFSEVFSNKSFYNKSGAFLYRMTYLKFFYLLYCIRELTLFFILRVPDYLDHIYYLKLKELFNNLSFFFNNNRILLELNDNVVLCEFRNFLNYNILRVQYFFVFLGVDSIVFKLDINPYSEYYLQRNCKFFITYFLYNIEEFFLFLKTQDFPEQDISSIDLYEKHAFIKFSKYEELLNIHALTIKSGNGYTDELYLMSIWFFHIFIELQLVRALAYKIDVDILLKDCFFF